MKLGAIYDFVVREGMAADIRSSRQLQKKLSGARGEYRKLSASGKRFFDAERLRNPYSDTRILYGDPRKEIASIMVGIDVEGAELLAADRLRERGTRIDAVISHHPEGGALARLHDVMGLQVDVLERFGVSRDIAQDLMKKRMQEVERRLVSGNHTRPIDIARLLDIPFMCCHTPADNHVVQYLQRKIDTTKPRRLKDVIALLFKEPEYQDAARHNAGPCILVGKPEDAAGKVMVDMTGGTEGSKEVFARVSQAGVKTLLCMHLSESHYTKIKSEYINVINAGHISSDNIGVNLLLDKLEKRAKLAIIECSGFRRVRRARG